MENTESQKILLREFTGKQLKKYWGQYKDTAILAGTYPAGSDKHFLQFIRIQKSIES